MPLSLKSLVPQPLLAFYRRRSSVFRLRRAASRWIRRAPAFAHRKVCLLATYSKDGDVSEHTLHLAKAWSAQGYLVVLIVALDDLDLWTAGSYPAADTLPYIAGILLRSNVGYDFGSWATALRTRRDCRKAERLVVTNDSVYGPLDGFPATLVRAEASKADVVALTDSYELRHHIQSFLVFYGPRALRSRYFRAFWAAIGAFDRNAAIEYAELPQLSGLRAAGLSVEILFATSPATTGNPTLIAWRDLVETGFPFVKIELLRSNPRQADIDGWAPFIAARGYDVALIRRQLGAGFEQSAAGISQSRSSPGSV